jgi:GT2 family glycosyltransferase
MTPWLSVIVPVHDGACFLEATLASAAAERPHGVEFLLYDSGDDAGAACRIARTFADRLNIRWRATPDVVSWTAKTNLGAREARADHVCMLHQDDLWLPGHLAAVRAALAADPDAVMSIAPSRFVSASGKAMGSWRLPFQSGPVTGADFISTLLVQNSVAIPSPVIRRDAWLGIGGLDEQLWYTADWDLYLRIARQGSVFVRAVETTAFRLHGNSLTVTGSSDACGFRAQLETVVDRHLLVVPVARRHRSSRLARASIEINCALAASMSGRRRELFGFIGALIKLGPVDCLAYVRQSRIVDRLMPRIMLRVTGAL